MVFVAPWFFERCVMPLATLVFAVGDVQTAAQFQWFSQHVKSDAVQAHMSSFVNEYFARIHGVCCAAPESLVANSSGAHGNGTMKAMYERFAARFVAAFVATLVVVRLELLKKQFRKATKQHFVAEGKTETTVDRGTEGVRGLASKNRIKTKTE